MELFYAGKAGEAAVVDIVFVHGSGGDAVGTWTKDAVCWPRDLLKVDVSNARILSWKYDSGVISSSQGGTFDHAETLLTDLAAVRQEEHEVFIYSKF